jgi:hypothetical protein
VGAPAAGERLVGWLVGIPFSVLVMIKLRCTIDAYPCGFMSFTGGFTWHLLVGAVVFLVTWGFAGALLHQIRPVGWTTWMERLGRAGAPGLGLWVAVIRETLPVRVIHPPSYGGPCPDLPVICHDLPLLGFGGLLYWTAPFGLWAVVTLWVDLKRALRRGDSNGHSGD